MRISEAAWEELIGAAGHYEARSPGVGDRFLLEFELLIGQIEIFPSAGLLVRSGLRQRLVPDFPFLVLYTTDASDSEVIAVAHTSRQAEYWLGRWQIREPVVPYLSLAA